MNIYDHNQIRIKKVLQLMRERSLSQFLISDPKSIFYLTDINIEPMERLFALLLRANGKHVLFLNTLFVVPDISMQKVWFHDTDPYLYLLSNEIDSSQLLAIDDNLPSRFLVPILANLPGQKVTLGSECIDMVRACKDSNEQNLMRKSSYFNDQVMEQLTTFIQKGMCEKEISDYIVQQFRSLGCQCSNEFIVSFGANGADAHHRPDRTELQNGDSILIDMGCEWEHYCSDMTRTFFCGSATEKQKEVYDLVLAANEAAENMVRPGTLLSDVDAAARNLIAQAGYGSYFNHRLGHFIGQSGHEKGDVSSSSNIVASEGMIFSIEPGIYLPRQFGIRIEDLVLVTADGCEILNSSSKKIRFL